MKKLSSLFVLGVLFGSLNSNFSIARMEILEDAGDVPVAAEKPTEPRNHYEELKQCINLGWRGCLIDHHEDYRDCVKQNEDRGVKLEDTLKFCAKWAMDKMDACLTNTKNACVVKFGSGLLDGLLTNVRQ